MKEISFNAEMKETKIPKCGKKEIPLVQQKIPKKEIYLPVKMKEILLPAEMKEIQDLLQRKKYLVLRMKRKMFLTEKEGSCATACRKLNVFLEHMMMLCVLQKKTASDSKEEGSCSSKKKESYERR